MNMVILQIVKSVDVVLVRVGRSNLGGLSNEGENLSRGQQLWFGLIVFQYSFLCVVFFPLLL